MFRKEETLGKKNDAVTFGCAKEKNKNHNAYLTLYANSNFNWITDLRLKTRLPG